tara:strand:- start:49576 stop:51270 length:1695 start_codon:yes stop_codon:yes gene_type:complete
MVAITNTTSLTFLKEEIDSTLHEAEKHLEAYAADESLEDQLSLCVEAFHQLRGIFQVLELPAATLMAEEMELVAQSTSNSGDVQRYARALSQAIVLLGRYLEYVQLKNRALPELMIGGINELRREARKSLILESHFFAVDLSRDRFPAIAAADTPAEEIPRLCRRLRHMYQVGLLGVLRSHNSQASLKLMARALSRIDRLCGPVPVSRMWWVARAAVEAMIADEMVLTPARKALLSQYDRQIKKVIYEGVRVLQADVPLLMVKESIYVASLCSQSSGLIGEVKQVYDLRPRLTAAVLQDETVLMSGGGGSVLRTVAGNLKTELGDVKQSLEMASQGVADTDYADVADALGRIAGTLIMVNLNQEAAKIRERATIVRAWKSEAIDPMGLEFQEFIDDLLSIENAIAGLERTMTPLDDVKNQEHNSRISLYQLDEARVAVVGESRSGLALTKRGVASYVESSWDHMHLANIPSTLASVSGGLTFLNLHRAKAVMDACRQYIEQTLLREDSEKPTTEQMETLADAISSIDYYLESMEEQKPIGESVLEVAEESMEELGYPVARAVAQ